MSPHPIILALIAIILLGVGVIYAAYIYNNPPKEGWTWLSVVVGDTITDLGMASAIATILAWYGVWGALWCLPLVPFVAHLLTGLPMIAGQIKLKFDQEKTSEQIKENGPR